MQVTSHYPQWRVLERISWLAVFFVVFFYAINSVQAAELTALEKGRIALAFPQSGTISEPDRKSVV